MERENIRVAVLTDAPDARFAGTATKVGDVPASAGPRAGRKRAAVEFHRRISGLPQRALLGGTMTLSNGDRLTATVLTSGGIAVGEAPTYRGSLGHPLVPGLPDEFGAAVVAGLLKGADRAGAIVVDRAAYDPVESSAVAFGAAAVLLAAVLVNHDERDAEASILATMKGLRVS